MDVPTIPDQEFAERCEKAQALLRDRGLDAVLVFSTESEPAGVRYFADYWPSFETAGVLIPASGKPTLLIGPESETYASARSRIEDILRMRDFRESSMPDYPGSKLPTWREVLGDGGIRRLGIAGWHLVPSTIVRNIAAVLGDESLADADALVRTLSLCKSEAELDCLREAARISELGFPAPCWPREPRRPAIRSGVAAGQTPSRRSAGRPTARCAKGR